MELNKPQAAAAAHNRGPCMVLSGPGSGKTTVIAERVKNLIRQYHVPPEEILVVTFTRAAAAEMQARFLRLMGEETTEVTFGTFHSVFFRILRMERRYGEDTILEHETKVRILQDVLRQIDSAVDPDREFLNGLLSEISFIKNNQLNLSQYQPKNSRIDFKAVYIGFNKQLKRQGRLDFDDILTETYALFQSDSRVLEFWRQKFKYVLIDEFQDINRVQYECIRLLAAPLNNLFIVGDDDQSVYAFRGARPDIMLDFPRDYPDTKKIILDVNYRSTKEIVNLSLRLIDKNKSRYKKKLKAAGEKGEAVEYKTFKTDNEEADYLVNEVIAAWNGGTALHRMAVLTRTNGGSLTVVKKCIEKEVPFRTKDRIPNVFMHFVVKPVFAALNWAMGNRSRANFLKFMNCPYRYIEREMLLDSEVDLEALEKAYRTITEKKWMGDRVEFFAYQLELLTKIHVPFAMINYFRKGMGYDSYVREMAERKKLDAEELLTLLDEVQDSAKDYENTAAWYRYVAAYTGKLNEREKTQTEEKDKLVISTLHAAKGLEYEEVFIPDLNERNIPHEKSLGDDQIEEELRMLYVGMTRAKTKLHLFSIRERFGKSLAKSRFLKDMGLSE